MFTHIVFIRLKDKSEDNARRTRDALISMDGKIPMLKQIEVGIDVIHSTRSYDVALVTRFDSLSDMEAYQIHPVHQEVLKFLGTVAESSAAVDYEG